MATTLGGSGDGCWSNSAVTKSESLQHRAKQYALRLIRLIQKLPRTDEARVIGRQLLRCGTSVAANYRAAGRARTRREFASKLGIVVEEADESVFWLELLIEAGIVAKRRMVSLLAEANELLAIFAASRRTAQARCRKPRSTDEPIHRSTDS